MALLIVAITALGWSQFRWLDELREEQTARRFATLEAAAERLDEQLTELLTRSIDDPAAAGAVRIVWDGERASMSVAGTSRPITRAELRQWLGPVEGLGEAASNPGWSLTPLAWVHCQSACNATVPQAAALRQHIESLAKRAFGDDLASLQIQIVAAKNGRVGVVFYPHPGDPPLLSADLEVPILEGLTRMDPDDRWSLRIRHASGSLQEFVSGAFWRNVLVSLALIVACVAAAAMILIGVRRRQRLARSQLLFVASASHELRTPISVIQAAAENLSDGVVAEAGRVREYGALIHAEADRLSALVDNVLAFSASHAQALDLKTIDVTDILNEVIQAHAGILQRFDLRLRLEPQPPIDGDPRALRAALGNLLGNAAKYASESWIEIDVRSVATKRGGRVIAISFTNPVSGRIDRDPERWFEPFVRGKSALDRDIPGTGIGLAVTRTIALRHGGGISVSTDQPGAVRFTLYLPVKDP